VATSSSHAISTRDLAGTIVSVSSDQSYNSSGATAAVVAADVIGVDVVGVDVVDVVVVITVGSIAVHSIGVKREASSHVV
jgi:hypothetical protein